MSLYENLELSMDKSCVTCTYLWQQPIRIYESHEEWWSYCSKKDKEVNEEDCCDDWCDDLE